MRMRTKEEHVNSDIRPDHNTMANTCGTKIPSHHVKVKEDRVSAHLCQHESLALMGQVNKASIDALTAQVKMIEAHVEKQYKIEPGYVGLQSLPGVGKILGLTILLEPIELYQPVSLEWATTSHTAVRRRARGRAPRR